MPRFSQEKLIKSVKKRKKQEVEIPMAGSKPGPPPIPTALKILEGNPGQRRLPENEIQIIPGLPDPPSFLCDVAKKEWEERGPALVRMGVLTPVDLAIFTAYCQAWAIYVTAWEGLNQLMRSLNQVNPETGKKMGHSSGAFITGTVQGGMKKSPLLAAANDASVLMIRFASELGLTPAARAQLEVIPVEETTESKLQGYLYSEKKRGA